MMETVVLILTIMICFNYVLKQTFRKTGFVVLSAATCAMFVGLTWPYAIEQSKARISGWLTNQELMLDIAVILTVEVAAQMAFCILAADIRTSGRIKPLKIWAYRILRWFPGILIYPVLFCLLVTAIFSFPGVSYPSIAWVLAFVVFLVISLLGYGMRLSLPEKEIRLELLFLSNALMAVIGIVATVNGRTAVTGASEVNWPALGSVFLSLCGGILGGMTVFKMRIKKLNNKNQIKS